MSGNVGNNPYRASGVVADAAAAYDDDQIQSNIAVLGFYVAVNGSLVRYNLVDQAIDEYFDTSGVDASASTNEARSGSSPYYYYGETTGSPTITEDADATGTDGDYSWYAWTDTAATGSYQTNTAQNADIFVLAGGGGGGNDQGGAGGGAGGFKYYSQYESVGTGAVTVTVGAGGIGTCPDYVPNNMGNDSSFGSLVAAAGGGGGGGGGCGPQRTGSNGGSGGGGGFRGGQAGGTGVANQGYAGGAGMGPTSPTSGDSGGGGGGASAIGLQAPTANGGAGGAGYTEGTSTVYDWTLADGTTATFDIDGVGTIYAGGGGGGSETGPAGLAGAGGGGNGGVAATANTGGGGGGGLGASAPGNNGKAGGSGIVMLRRLTNITTAGGDLTLQSTDVTAESAPDYGEIVMLIENAYGTATLNTDIKSYVSRDSGTTFTQGTLVDEGTWGTNKKILGFHDLDISGQPSGVAMCYKIETLNQAASSKETRIYGTSIGWK